MQTLEADAASRQQAHDAERKGFEAEVEEMKSKLAMAELDLQASKAKGEALEVYATAPPAHLESYACVGDRLR